jgi:hypothetical protein
MKQLLLLAVALFPMGHLHAAGTGFKTGQTFKLKVVRVSSTIKTGYFGVETRSKIPQTVPNFKKSDLISFAIAKGGVLTAKGIRIPFAHESKGVVEYNAFKEGTITWTANAELNKAGGQATGGRLSYFIQDFSGAEPVFRTVVYQLD